MSTITKIPTRHPNVPSRKLALPEQAQDIQKAKGLYTVDRGVAYALPIDSVKDKHQWRGQDVWTHDKVHGTYRKGTKFAPFQTMFQRRALEWARDHIHPEIPYWYYTAVLGHDLHVSTWGELYGRHWHAGWADPFTGEITPALDMSFETLFKTHWVDHECDLPCCPRDAGINIELLQSLGGFVEDLGLLGMAKVTDAFVSEEIDELVSTTGTEYADFDFHEVGTNAAVENNDHTALQTSSGIARATGTPTDSDPIYQNVGTITADATETWEEHGLFNNVTSVAMMDRTLTGGQSVDASDQVEYTYQLTKNPEA